MSRNRIPTEYLAAGGLAVLGALVWFRKPIEDEVRDVFARGDRLTYGAVDETNGIVLDSPSVLVGAASARAGFDVPAGVYALARMIRSEGAAAGDLRAHVALNDLADLGWSSLTSLMLFTNAAWAQGTYGKQHSTVYQTPTGGATSDPKAAAIVNGKRKVLRSQTRRYSTWRDPYLGDVQTAMKAIADREKGIDRARGAVKFVDVSSMDGVQSGTGSYAALVERWGNEGLSPFTIPEYGTDLVLFKRT